MIALVLAMVWTRRGQAVTLALLTLFGVAASVAAPAYLRAVDRAVAAGQIATASPTELSLSVAGNQDNRLDAGGPSFTDVGAALLSLPGFTFVYAAEFEAIGLEKDNVHASRVVFRQDACAHVRILAGRCLIGEGEVLLGEHTAARLGLVAGSPLRMASARFNDDERHPEYLPDGVAKDLVVAGVYRPADPVERYWGTHGYFTALPGGGPDEPLLLGADTMTVFDHGMTALAIDGTAGPGALDIDRLGQLRVGLEYLRVTSQQLGRVLITTDMAALLDRIDAGRSSARLLVPVLAVPLVLLACFTIFLAVSYGSQGRQPELALVALRGARWWTRWWLAMGESLVAVLAGALAGCLAGQLLVDAIAAALFPGVGADAGWSSLRYAPFATLAALAAAVLAQRRQLLSSVVTLLRRNPPAADGPRALAVEAIVVLLAVISIVQLIVTDGSLTGVGVLAPAFGILALALLAARALLPAVTRYATGALSGGRLGVALAGFQLSRRPGAQRLFALLVATVAVAGYAACAIDVAARGRVVQAGLGVGADRVLSIEPVSRSRLLDAVHRLDPDGAFAMAVARMPSAAADEPIGLAVDSPRLAAVAIWPSGAPPAGTVADRLRPAAPPLVRFAGGDLTVEATTSGMTPDNELQMRLAVSSVTGLGDAVVQLGELNPGRYRYQQRVPVCRQGCRLNGIQFAVGGVSVGVTGRVVISGLGSINPVKAALPAAELADPARWRTTGEARASTAPGGLQIDVNAPGGLPTGAWLQPVTTPWPLPVAVAGARPTADAISGLDGRSVQVSVVEGLPAAPRVGVHATLADLEYTDRLATDAGRALEPQVWLNAKAPADVVDRLSVLGLTVTGDTRSALVKRQLDKQGPALALWFHALAGTLAVLLGAGALVLAAAVDRARRREDLAALRAQGLSHAAMSRATLWTYPVLVGIAAVTGMIIALACWALTGWALPLSGLNPPPLPMPGRPRVLTLAGTVVAVLLLLTLVAAATGRDLRRRIERTNGRGPS